MEDRNTAQRVMDPPDLNAETYPFDVVQQLIDQAAYFSFFSQPATVGGSAAQELDGGIVGVHVDEVLHPFHIGLRASRAGFGPQAENAAGSPAARFRARWMLIPDEYRALPRRPVPATRFDASRPQRFAMLDADFAFLEGEDGFRGFGAGATFPSPGGGPVGAAAVGTLLDGRGRFRGVTATYTYCGTLDPDRGFRGHLMLRAMDPDGRFTSSSAPAPAASGADLEPQATFLLVRGQKSGPSELTQYDFSPSGGIQGFHLEQELWALDLATVHSPAGPASSARAGDFLGTMRSRVNLDILNPGAPGTDVSPIPFTTHNDYRFTDTDGRELGRITAEGGEGRSFNAALPAAPGQQALRFGAFQRLTGGGGSLAGVRGLLTDNSVVGVAPHATSTLYVLRIEDPERRFRTPGGA